MPAVMSAPPIGTESYRASGSWRDRAMTDAERAWWREAVCELWEEFDCTPAWPSPVRLQCAERARFAAAVEEIKTRFIQKFGRG